MTYNSAFWMGFTAVCLKRYAIVAGPMSIFFLAMGKITLVKVMVLVVLFGLVWPPVFVVVAWTLFRFRVRRTPESNVGALNDRERGRWAARIGTRM